MKVEEMAEAVASGGIGRVDPAAAWQQLRRFLRPSWGAVDQFKFVACTTGISISFLSFRIFPTVRQNRTAFKNLLRRSIQPRPWPIILRAFWMSSRGGPHFSDHF